jgi:sugar phosphate isomerase/epimerase
MTLPTTASLTAAAQGKMTLALHQTTSAAAGYRKSLEGWARAGIKEVEITNTVLDEFLKTDNLAAARSLLADLGLTPVQAAVGTTGLWEPNPNRAASIEDFKHRCETFAKLGLKSVYATTVCTQKVTPEDYTTAAQKLHEAAEIAHQFQLALRVEFIRQSSFISTLPTLVQLIRAANHPNLGVMFDFYHFYSGLSKLEDLDDLRPGEIAHVHFQDIPAMPRELLDSITRVIPGDGIAPLSPILKKLAALGYAGPLSVELFLPKFQQADPFEIANEIRRKSEAVMRHAGVI